MDCLDIDELSVLLLLSSWEGLVGFGAGAGAGARAICEGWPELDGLWIPVISSLLKLSTSKDGFVVPRLVLSASGRSNKKSR
jgi:hypothetical protein